VVTCLFLQKKNNEAQSTEFHGGCSGRLEFTTGSLTITTKTHLFKQAYSL